VETVGPGAQDPVLAQWWAKAAEYRRGGLDRILVPAPWTRTIDELCGAGVRGRCYAHELIRVRPGAASDFLELVRTDAMPLGDAFGWELAGAWRTAMANDDECILLWAVPAWEAWAAFERALSADADVRGRRSGLAGMAESWQRILLVDAPLSPFKTGRQPSRDDRTEADSPVTRRD
jgi:hypothetical protein